MKSPEARASNFSGASSELASALGHAIEHDELDALYQPVIDLRSGRPARLEALIRWNRPGLRTLTPDKFLSIAEQTGVIEHLGAWIIERALQDCASWQHDAPGLGVSINVSAEQLDDELIERLDTGIAAFAIKPELFEIEITEAAYRKHGDRAIHILERVRDLGVKIALDDFGTGPSSLTWLSRAPLDELKIDRPIVSTLEDPNSEPRLLTAIIRTAQAFGLTAIAEGVDSTRKLRQLHELGCHYAQGNRLARPAPITHILRALSVGSPAHADTTWSS